MNNSDFTPWPETFNQKYIDQGYWQGEPLANLIAQASIKYKDNIALICNDKEYTYQALEDKCIALSIGLKELGLNSGDKVVVHLPNIAEFYISFFALLKIGVQPVLALPAHRFSEINYFCKFVEAKAYLMAPQHGFDSFELAKKVKDANPNLESIIYCGQKELLVNSCDFKSELTFIEDLYQKESYLAKLKLNTFAFFQLSGGTTGTPKLIPRTDNDYLYSVRASVEVCQFTEQTRYLCVLPAAHNFSLSSPGALGCFLSGGTVVLTDDPSPSNAFDLIKKHKITVSAVVPPLALLWIELSKNQKHKLSTLQVLQVGGARLNENTALRIAPELGCVLQQVFGMAEGLVNYTRLDDSIDVIVNTQGRPMSDADEIKIVDNNGVAVKANQAGSLLTRGPYTIRGYYRAPKHNKQAFTSDGFYITGDIVVITEEGNIQVVGRDKDQINRGGEKIAAQEIENYLLDHNAIHDAAIIAVPDDYLGEKSCAVLVCNNENRPKVIEIKRFLRNKGLADFKIPDRIEFLNVLPKTPVGKINKNKLRELL
ncbi:(2,3-dihydroxybenzoyl)adenylate synthase [Pseudoalteromonas sp. NBT06-2]|uniref:(2,3-dihydroxybenzoyl)adenylate synthase n=1 Tax=Pseudoalteromonas sp. NBT06-2 TaxID=2025950 RepID=UPI000BA6A8AE|nr:(2,3-dihydroxybenzoyl)adenylate synthase [Pseudoalteromonas sp. NBT06-2]PAJ75452.1 (2,3-dihydroxybenzoyl)adenylate synthase [Pseudoalteromonas sp. NBT06-2]